jgi:hypothetical protein
MSFVRLRSANRSPPLSGQKRFIHWVTRRHMAQPITADEPAHAKGEIMAR